MSPLGIALATSAVPSVGMTETQPSNLWAAGAIQDEAAVVALKRESHEEDPFPHQNGTHFR